jgi:hypothetical protein
MVPTMEELTVVSKVRGSGLSPQGCLAPKPPGLLYIDHGTLPVGVSC